VLRRARRPSGHAAGARRHPPGEDPNVHSVARATRFRSLLAVFVAVLLAASGGCGGGGNDGDDARSVIFWHSMAGDLKAVLESLVEKFNRKGPSHPVVLRYQGEYGQLKTKITNAVQANSPPDMAMMYEAWIAYCNTDKGREAILALDEFIRRDAREVDVADIYPVYIRDNTFDGKVYSFPFNKSFPVLFYNKELFVKAGLDPARPPATWEEFAAVGRKLTRDTDGDGQKDVWGWAFNVDPWIFECMVLQAGGSLADGDTGIKPLDSPEMLAAIQFYADAIDGPDPYAYRTTGREFQNDFVSQRVAMIITTCVSKPFMIDQIGFEWGMAPLPVGKVNVSIMSGTNIAIFAQAPREKQEVAWKFIKYFTSRDTTAYWAMRTAYVPVRRSAVESKEFQEYMKSDPTPMAAIAQLENATFEPRAQGWVDVRDRLGQALLRSLLKKKTPRENLRQVMDDVGRLRKS
jgi:ABC-type glycerol-3-phosphate transport system substrate-binding protein